MTHEPEPRELEASPMNADRDREADEQTIAERCDKAMQAREWAVTQAFNCIDQLADLANQAAQQNTVVVVALGQLGRHGDDPYTDFRDRLTRRLHGRLAALRPYIPYVTVTDESEER